MWNALRVHNQSTVTAGRYSFRQQAGCNDVKIMEFNLKKYQAPRNAKHKELSNYKFL
jgi:hypothetical protein